MLKKEKFYTKLKKWFWLSVVAGLLPIFIRIVVYILFKDHRAHLHPFDIGDTLLLGLVLNIGNSYEIDDLSVYSY